MKGPHFAPVNSRYGAPMGRRDFPTVEPVKMRLVPVPMVDGCYDPGGAYWGAGVPLWASWGHDPDGDAVTVYVRAWNRGKAKLAVIEECPLATFWR